MTKRFAVNIIGYIEDPNDKYSSNDIEKLLNRREVLHCFVPLNTIGVIAKQMPDESISIDLKKVKKHYHVSLTGK